MRQARPPLPSDPRSVEPSAPVYGAGSYYTQADQYYARQPGEEVDPYGLAEEAHPHWRGAGAKKVRTTLGRARPAAQRPVVSVDPNARLASALHPTTMPAAQVRVMSESDLQAQLLPHRPAAMLFLRPLVSRELRGRRWLFAALAMVIAAAYLVAILHFWAPASATPQAHAQLLAGRLIAQQKSMRYVPPDPFSFVGPGWVAGDRVVVNTDGAAVQEYFPKEPAGMAALYAVCFRLAGDPEEAIRWAHLLNPVAAGLAVLGAFFLCRFAGGSFLGLLGMVAMAASQALLNAAGDAAGAAVSLAMVTWGLCLLLWWWRAGNPLSGFAAGLLLGLAVTLRYADALLVVPLAFACVFAWNWRRPLSSFLRGLAPIAGWALPVAALLWWNQREMGAWTAYHLAGQVGALDPDNLANNWESLLLRLADSGLYFLLPLGGLGLLTLIARRFPLGLVMLAWCVLPMLGFAAYVWNVDQRQNLPFILTITPVVLFGVTYLLRRVLWAPSDSPPQIIAAQDPYTGQPVHMIAEAATPAWRSLASPIAAGLVIAAAVFVSISRVTGDVQFPQATLARHERTANLAALVSFARASAPPQSALFVDVSAAGDQPAFLLDVAGQWELYDATAFSPRYARRFASPWSSTAIDAPSRRRYEYLQHLYDGAGEPELAAQVHRITDRALEQDREVYLLMTALDLRRFTQTHFLRGYEAHTIGVFTEWSASPPDGSTDAAQPAGAQWLLVRVTREREASPPATVVNAL